MYRIQYECSNCKTNHTRWETFNCIKIMPGLKEDGSPMNINECLQKELADEDIEGYACDTCKVSTFKATKRIVLPLDFLSKARIGRNTAQASRS